MAWLPTQAGFSRAAHTHKAHNAKMGGASTQAAPSLPTLSLARNNFKPRPQTSTTLINTKTLGKEAYGATSQLSKKNVHIIFEVIGIFQHYRK